MSYDALRVERQGPVGWLVFDRPEVGNAMNATMLTELERAWEEFGIDPYRFSDMRVGCYDPVERVRDMDVDGVWAQTTFPSLPGFGSSGSMPEASDGAPFPTSVGLP